MRQKGFRGWITTLAIGVLVFGFVLPGLAQEKFGLKDIPEIKNKEPINMIVETGAAWDKVIDYIRQFETATGVKVNIERVASPVVYSKENVELMAETGHYDVVYVETSWTCEWSDFLWNLEELATQYDPNGVEGFKEDIQNMSPVLLRCGQAYGEQKVLPFYTYHVGMFLRQDVYDDPTEQANFKAKYGYDLKPPVTEKELYDQAEFFTRKKGELLKGQPLEHDLYGVAMMAGAYQINDEITSRIWGKGGDYATVVRNSDGTLKEFVITNKDKDILKEALTEYKDLLKFAPAGCLTANFDFTCAQQGEGHAIIQPHQFASLFTFTADLLKQHVPDGRLSIYPTIGGQPYTGAWSLGVAKASKNPEAAYWLVRYISSYDCQKVLMKEGGQFSARMDLMLDPEFHTAETEYPLGIVCTYLVDIWESQAPYVDNYWYFNTKAGGKVYEMQMNVLHKPMADQQTIDECIRELVDKTIELTSKFDDVPIREEE